MSQKLQWIHTPLQSRSQKTLHALLDAAGLLLKERPFSAISVQDITQAAGSSVGAFYARFPDKMSVLHALHERYVDQAKATASAALEPARWDGVSLGQIFSQICAFLVESNEETAGVRRGVILAAVERPEFAKRRMEYNLALSGGMRELLEARSDEIGHPDPIEASYFVQQLLVTWFDQFALFGRAEGRTSAQAANDLTRAITRFLDVEWDV